jgi:hypothetical protein
VASSSPRVLAVRNVERSGLGRLLPWWEEMGLQVVEVGGVSAPATPEGFDGVVVGWATRLGQVVLDGHHPHAPAGWSEQGGWAGRHCLGQWFDLGEAGPYVVVEAAGEHQRVGVVRSVDEHGR